LVPGEKAIQLVGYKGNAPIYSETYTVTHLDILSTRDAYTTYFSQLNDLHVNGMLLQAMPGSAAGERRLLQTTHNYAHNFEYSFIIRHPVRVAATNAILHYRDVAIVEPENDFVVVEATQNGLDWIELTPRYDARLVPAWLSAYTAGQPGTKAMLTDHQVNLLDYFSAGEEVLIRFRMKTNGTVHAWGWAVDLVSIQQAPTGLTETPSLTAVHWYPNPADVQLTITYELKKTTPVSWRIIDLQGRVNVTTETVTRQAGTYTDLVDVSRLVPGTYVARGPDNIALKFMVSR
jgi:hypothetical protein